MNSAEIESPKGSELSRICPHCTLSLEETAAHILWVCSLNARLRAEANIYLDLVLLSSHARARIPNDWSEWPSPLRDFDIIGLEADIVEL